MVNTGVYGWFNVVLFAEVRVWRPRAIVLAQVERHGKCTSVSLSGSVDGEYIEVNIVLSSYCSGSLRGKSRALVETKVR